MDVRSLRFALTLADELHFGRAAARHSISAQPFGLAIQKLESEIGYSLFDRTSRRVETTSRGETFLAGAAVAVEMFDDLLVDRETPGSDEDHLTIGILGIGLAGLWSNFSDLLHEASPDLTTSYHDLALADQYRAVRDGRIDIGIVQYIEPIDGLDLTPILTSPRAAVVPSRSEFASATRLSLSDIGGEPWIDVYAGSTPLSSWLGEAWATGKHGDRVYTPAAIPAAVATTQRIGVHALAAGKYYSDPRATFVPLEGEACVIAIAVRAGDHRPVVRAARGAADLLLRLHRTGGELIEC